MAPSLEPIRVPVVIRAGLAEKFQLHLLELALAKDEVSGRNLVAVRLADLGDAKGQPQPRRIEHVLEVYKHALGGFGTQIGNGRIILHRADERLEHSQEAAGLSEVTAAIGTLFAFQMVHAKALVATRALHQRIGKVGGVAGCPPHIGVHNDPGLNADHILSRTDGIVPPGLAHVAFQRNPQRPIVPEALKTTVDFAGGIDKSPPLTQTNDFFHYIGFCCQRDSLHD